MEIDLFGPDFWKRHKESDGVGQGTGTAKPNIDGHSHPSSDFVAIDIEYSDSEQNICQFGLAVVKNLQITETRCWNIKPPGNRYDAQYTRTHHMTAEDTADSPSFAEVWPEIEPYLREQKLWAHNATSVEEPILNKNLAMHKIQAAERWYWINDSRSLYGRKECPGKGNGLEQCCMALGMPCENHHNAEADAVMCAKIVIAHLQGQQPNWEGVPVTKEALRKSRQEKRILRLGGFAEYFANTSSGEEDVFAVLSSTCDDMEVEHVIDVFDRGDKILEGNTDNVDFSRLNTGDGNPLFGKRVVVTGMFRVNRKDVEKALEVMGAKKTATISSKTDAVIVGTRNVGPNKLLALEEQELKGNHIARIVGDDDLETLLYGDGHKFF